MEKIDRILNHDLFNECIEKNKMAEAARCFCHHDMGHFLDVARIAMILNLQEHVGIEQDVIYGAALLHDIGRFKQYEDGTPHETVSARLAPAILKDCGYTDKETDVIVTAIANHRNQEIKMRQDMSGILYRADKASRSCFSCEMKAECNWKNDKKNMHITL